MRYAVIVIIDDYKNEAVYFFCISEWCSSQPRTRSPRRLVGLSSWRDRPQGRIPSQIIPLPEVYPSWINARPKCTWRRRILIIFKLLNVFWVQHVVPNRFSIFRPFPLLPLHLIVIQKVSETARVNMVQDEN